MKESFTWRPAFRACCLNLGLMVAVLLGATPAYAANPTQFFELDGNILPGGDPGPDWDDIFLSNAPGKGATPKSLPSGFSSPVFVPDFNLADTKDESLFATGSKDTLNITPGWECKRTNNVNDKTDINNAYAVAYTASAASVGDTKDHLIVYFALDVVSNEGTKNVAFWFLKDPNVGCVPNGSFTGNHSDGDVLIVAEYTSGGRVSTIKAYRWNGGASGSLNPNPIGEGADCQDAVSTTHVCARTNGAVLNGDGATPDVPWVVKTKTSNPQGDGYNSARDLDVGEFFEGGIDLTALGISGCFNRYLADTRSSTSLTSTIFDYALGNFSNCSIGATKNCAAASVNDDFTTFTSPFTVVITNTSPGGSVHDVSFSESGAAPPAGTTCTIVSNTGDQNVNGTGLTNGVPVKVDSELPSGTSVTVGISCTGTANSFPNSILATAGSAPGQSDITRNAVVSSASADACKADVRGGLTLVKDCRGMELVGGTTGTPITLKANVKVRVTNEAIGGSNQVITLTDVSDNKVSSLSQVECGDLSTPKSDLALSPNEAACFVGSYTPTAGDLSNPPSGAAFTDTASATGEGSISGNFTASDDATCFLCDTDVDGIPDVIDPDSGPN